MLSTLLFNIIFWIALLAAVTVSLYSCLVLWFRFTYRHIPCPQKVRQAIVFNNGDDVITFFFFGHSLVLRKAFIHNGHFYDLLGQWAQEYGDVFVIYNFYKPWVFTCNPNGVKDLFITKDFPKSKEAYSVTRNVLGTRLLGTGLFTDINKVTWGHRRHELNTAFHKTSLMELVPEFNTVGNQLLEVLGKHADQGNIIELCTWLQRTALAALCKVAFGKEVNTFGTNDQFTNAISKVMETLGENMRDPTLRIPFRSGTIKKTFAKAMEMIKGLGTEWMNEREKANKNDEYVPNDILNTLVKMKAQGAYSHDPEQLMDDFITFYIAGHETSANFMSFMILEAARHPYVLEKMYKEVDEVLGQKAEITYADVNKLEYIPLVMKETLRMYPIGAFFFRDTDEEFKVDGFQIPKNTTMMISPYVSQRSSNYVPNPLEFKPERFLPDAPDRPAAYTYLPFAIGPRSCIGRNFAIIESRIIIAKLLQHFKFELDHTQSFNIVDCGSLRPKDNVRVRLSWR